MCEIRLLRADEIDVKVKQVTAKGAQALLYKTSRTDMAILDETFGTFNWTDDYRDIDGVLYCGIGARKNPSDPFVWKWSNGIESRSDDEGNEVKGEASDAFKRAGFLWGIGRELYTSPFIWINAATQPKKNGNGYELVDRYAKYSVKTIECDDGRRISHLEIVNDKGSVVFTFGSRKTKTEQKIEDLKKRVQSQTVDATIGKRAKTEQKISELERQFSDMEQEPLPWEDPEYLGENAFVDEPVIDDIWATAQACGISEQKVINGIYAYYKKERVEDLTVKEANDLLKRFKRMGDKQ